MISVKDLTNEELYEQIGKALEDMDSSEIGTGDYNCAEAELKVAVKEKERRKN